MGNGKHLKTFSLDASHLHAGRTHWHPWNRQTSDIRPILQKAIDRRSRHMPFTHISPHNSGMTRSQLEAYTS